MPKKKLNFLRIFTTGLIWIVLYCDLTDRICSATLGFSPLSGSDWGQRIGDFFNDRWVVRTGKDWGIFVCMLLFFPVLFIGWRKVYLFQWKRIIPRRFKKQPVIVRTSEPDLSKKSSAPQKLRIQTSALLSVPVGNAQAPASAETAGPVAGGTAAPTAAGYAAPTAQAPGSSSFVPPIPQFEDANEVQQMLSLTANVLADFFPHVLLDGRYASFAMSTDKLAAVFRIINRPESTFAVDTEVDIMESDWFYESGLIQTPAKDIIGIAKTLQENEPNSVATVVILLMGGQLLNVEETMAYFEKHEIMLLRTENVEIDEIPLVTDFLKDYFGLKGE